MTVTLLDLNGLKQEGAELTPVEEYVLAFHPSSAQLIGNVNTEMGILNLQNNQLPITVNNTEYENSYVCSPYTALVPYALQEINKVDNWLFKRCVKLMLPILGTYLKKNAINKLVHVNNWLLSTNLYPPNICGKDTEELTQLLINKYPGHSIAYRSLTRAFNPKLIRNLESQGYMLIPSRQVYLYDINKQDYTRKRDYKRDQKLRRETPYIYVAQNDILDSDIPRIVELYNKLYIEKYSIHNPQFNENYIRMAIKNEQFHTEGYRNSEGVLDAVGCSFSIGSSSSLPIVGYDTDKPINHGLYRLAIASAMKQVFDKKQLFNASSGVSEFKLTRGAKAEVEYTAIYVDHLPNKEKRMWRVIKHLLQKAAVPIVKKHRL